LTTDHHELELVILQEQNYSGLINNDKNNVSEVPLLNNHDHLHKEIKVKPPINYCVRFILTIVSFAIAFLNVVIAQNA